MFPVHNDELGERDEIGEAERAVAASVAPDEQPNQAAEPEGECGGIHDEDLLRNKLRRG